MIKQTEKHKLILKILIGAAWADRHLEPEEITFLEKTLERYQMKKDRELLDILKLPISIQTTESWVAEYFQSSTQNERMQLLVNIGKILMADNQVTDLEHDLLDDYYELMANIPAREETQPSANSKTNAVPRTEAPTQVKPNFLDGTKKVVQHIGQFVTRSIRKALHP